MPDMTAEARLILREMDSAPPSLVNIANAFSIPSRELPAPVTEASKRGLRFQRRVGKALARTAGSIGARLDIEPWFRYNISPENLGRCAVPDFILTFADFQLVIEVKLTFVLDAPQKLTKLYVPVVEKTYGLRPRPLVIARYLTSQAADYPRVETLSEALQTPSSAGVPVLHYLGIGGIPWQNAQPTVRFSESGAS
jgi:hypothetical protein